MKDSRAKEIRDIVRQQIIGAIEQDLENGESLMIVDVDVTAGIVTTEAQRWSWRRWKWEARR